MENKSQMVIKRSGEKGTREVKENILKDLKKKKKFRVRGGEDQGHQGG